MSKPRTVAYDTAQLSLFVLPEIVPIGDGSFRVVPRKPVVKCSVNQAARMTGMKRDNIYKLIEAEMIRFECPSPRKTLVFVDSVIDFLEASQKPGFWTEERKMRYYGKK